MEERENQLLYDDVCHQHLMQDNEKSNGGMRQNLCVKV